jgi:phage recombination protein Bet
MTTALQTLTSKLAARLEMGDGAGLLETLKATAFKSQIAVTDAQMTALMVVANQYGLNPWTKEIYAFPDKGGIVPIVGVDGWARIINSHPQFDGMDFEQDAESCTCIIYRKDRSHPIKVTEWMSECKRDNAQPWKTHPKRMLRHKAMIQCSRLAFGFTGIYDQDEAERIIESDIGAPVASTKAARNPSAAAAQNLPDGYEEFEAEHLELMREAAKNGSDALTSAFQALPKGKHKVAFWQAHQAELKASAQAATVIDSETGEITK